MPKQKTDSMLTAEEQAKRFKEAAEKAGLTTDEAEMERAFRAVAKPTKAREPRKT